MNDTTTTDDPIRFDNCECESPARDPVAYELPNGERIEIVGCVECGGAVEWEIDENNDDAYPEREGKQSHKVDVLESQCRRLKKEVEKPRGPWEVLNYHPDFFDPDETNINPEHLVSGRLKVKGENSSVYHLPHSTRVAVCGKKAFGGSLLGPRKFTSEYEVTDDEVRSLRPCSSCIKEKQKFHERRMMAIHLVGEVREVADGE